MVALGLYCELPFGKFDERNSRIIEVAKKLERSPGSLAMKLGNLASLDPVITSSGRKGLVGASKADRELWQKFSEQPSKIMPEIATALESLDKAAFKDSEIIELDDYREETATAIIQRRKSQSLFRKAVLSAYDNQCCVTGIADPRFLVASHIKPWAEDLDNRLNPRNGLCLSTFFDRAFDIGLITFSDDYALIVSSELEKQQSNDHIRETFLERSGTAIELPSKFSPSQDFMRWHRESLFIQ
ncbi:HNH endonuclease [Marinobacter sp. 1-3A]|uniref:HNH endonuclease n=1 Tax=Marinobacter sp. 1-3A TaxID=2582920 RepID=UPI0019089209|nr:HNH endonuclease [Marinobacter sp. 1-3A]MBK1872413.1 HNH endonuclease [Marinobacter sp. 1-3A]